MTSDRLIIYVDDDPDDVLLMQEAFTTVAGFQLLALSNGAELLQYLERAVCFPSLIILDINMPVLNGRDTLRLLKQHPLYSTIPAVIFTTTNQQNELLFAAAYGTDLVVKPYDFRSLRNIVQRLVGYAHQR